MTELPDAPLVRHRAAGIPAIAAAVLGVVVAVVGVGYAVEPSMFAEPRARAVERVTIPYGQQVVLPFVGLDHPRGLALDSSNNLYISDGGGSRILKLADNGNAPVEIFKNDVLKWSFSIAVDSSADVYAVTHNDSVLRIDGQTRTVTTLPIDGSLVAVDAEGTVYVGNSSGSQVLAMPVDSTDPRVLPFPALSQVSGVAVGPDGTVYVADRTSRASGRVLALGKGAVSPREVPFAGLSSPEAVAVDKHGVVYVSEYVDGGNNRVLALPPGTDIPTVLPFKGIESPCAIGVDSAGAVYVVDDHTGRVLKVSPA